MCTTIQQKKDEVPAVRKGENGKISVLVEAKGGKEEMGVVYK